ncbi:hypothetical protein FKP32DRAFT_86691 [Trametes sanguinea]|nr:hypothetical protein FKP32DRAFT_86691 [Trametes sanguinea]
MYISACWAPSTGQAGARRPPLAAVQRKGLWLVLPSSLPPANATRLALPQEHATHMRCPIQWFFYQKAHYCTLRREGTRIQGCLLRSQFTEAMSGARITSTHQRSAVVVLQGYILCLFVASVVLGAQWGDEGKGKRCACVLPVAFRTE